MLKKPDVIEKNNIRVHIRVQHPQVHQNQLVLSLSFFLCCTVLSKAKLRCQLDPLILFSAGVGERRSAGLN